MHREWWFQFLSLCEVEKYEFKKIVNREVDYFLFTISMTIYLVFIKIAVTAAISGFLRGEAGYVHTHTHRKTLDTR